MCIDYFLRIYIYKSFSRRWTSDQQSDQPIHYARILIKLNGAFDRSVLINIIY